MICAKWVGQFKVWLFNSTKEPGNPILRRKQDRLTSNAVVNYFSKTVLNQDADEYESLYGGSVQQQVYIDVRMDH